MLHVTKVESQVKGGVCCRLGQRTLLVGKRGSGKTSVVNAVELALTGCVSEVAGRRMVAREVDLLALAPGRQGNLAAEVTLSNGEKARWETQSKGKGSAKKGVHQLPPSLAAVGDPNRLLPSRDIEEAIVGSAETGRKFFLSRAAGEISSADILSKIPGCLHQHYQRALSSAVGDSVSQLLSVLEYAGTKQSEQTSEAKAQAKVLASNTGNLPAPLTESQLADLKKELEAKQKELTRIAVLTDRMEAASKRQEDLGPLRLQIQEMEQKLADQEQLQSDLLTKKADLLVQAKALPKVQPLTPGQQALVGFLQYQSGVSEIKTCLGCGNPTTAEVINKRLASVNKIVSGKQEQTSQIAKIKKDFSTTTADLAAVEKDIEWTKQQISGFQKTVEMLESALQQSSATEIPDLQEIQNQVDELNAHYIKMTNNRALWSSFQNARDHQLQAEKTAQEWKQLKETCSDIVAQLLDASVEKFAAEVQKRLPAHNKFCLRLREGAREVFQVGFEVDGDIRTALSAGEWASMLVAVSDVCRGNIPLSVIVQKDCSLSPQDLTDLMTSYQQSDSQVLITSTTEPVSVPAGWTVIRTDKGEHRQLSEIKEEKIEMEVEEKVEEKIEEKVEEKIHFDPDHNIKYCPAEIEIDGQRVACTKEAGHDWDDGHDYLRGLGPRPAYLAPSVKQAPPRVRIIDVPSDEPSPVVVTPAVDQKPKTRKTRKTTNAD